jgi:hypothetical protein
LTATSSNMEGRHTKRCFKKAVLGENVARQRWRTTQKQRQYSSIWVWKLPRRARTVDNASTVNILLTLYIFPLNSLDGSLHHLAMFQQLCHTTEFRRETQITIYSFQIQLISLQLSYTTKQNLYKVPQLAPKSHKPQPQLSPKTVSTRPLSLPQHGYRTRTAINSNTQTCLEQPVQGQNTKGEKRATAPVPLSGRRSPLFSETSVHKVRQLRSLLASSHLVAYTAIPIRYTCCIRQTDTELPLVDTMTLGK